VKALGIALIVSAALVVLAGFFYGEKTIPLGFGIGGLLLLCGVLCVGGNSGSAVHDALSENRPRDPSRPTTTRSDTERILEAFQSLEVETRRVRIECEKTKWAVRGGVCAVLVIALRLLNVL
jgi:hypothetical protein